MHFTRLGLSLACQILRNVATWVYLFGLTNKAMQLELLTTGAKIYCRAYLLICALPVLVVFFGYWTYLSTLCLRLLSTNRQIRYCRSFWFNLRGWGSCSWYRLGLFLAFLWSHLPSHSICFILVRLQEWVRGCGTKCSGEKTFLHSSEKTLYTLVTGQGDNWYLSWLGAFRDIFMNDNIRHLVNKFQDFEQQFLKQN